MSILSGLGGMAAVLPAAGARASSPEVPAPAPAGIRFEGVTVSYRGSVALDQLQLTVQPGEILALIGPSGSGKTTALRAVAGFVRPTAGRIHLGDTDVTDLPPHRRRIGMVVQQYALFEHMRVRDNVAFGLRAQGARGSAVAPRVKECLELVGMAEFTDRYPRQLSGGQQQRVAIARALAVRPRVLLLDEPLSALDARLRATMVNELLRLHCELPDLTILYVTHDQAEALTLGDRIGVMNQSRLVSVGPARDIYHRPPCLFTAEFLGSANLLPVVPCDHSPVANRVMVDFRGQRLHATVPPGCIANGGAATLCVRPHDLRLGASQGADNQLRGTLKRSQWVGQAFRLFVEVCGVELRVDAPRHDTALIPEPGGALTIHCSAGDATLIPEALPAT